MALNNLPYPQQRRQDAVQQPPHKGRHRAPRGQMEFRRRARLTRAVFAPTPRPRNAGDLQESLDEMKERNNNKWIMAFL